MVKFNTTAHSHVQLDGPPVSSDDPPGSITFKTSSQRGTFHGTYNKDRARDQKVKDLLREIERESALKHAASQKSGKSAGAKARLVQKQIDKKRRREKALEKKDKREGWAGNFGFGARLPEYKAEEDRYCPLAQARKFNRTTQKTDPETGAQLSPPRGVTMFKGTRGAHFNDPNPTPAILASATMGLSGGFDEYASYSSPKNSENVFSKTEPLPAIQQGAQGSNAQSSSTDPQSPPKSPQQSSPQTSPTSNPAPDVTISFQSAYENEDALEIVKLILSREKLVASLKSIIEGSEAELAVLRASGHEDKAKFPREAFDTELSDIRTATIKIVEMIKVWKQKQPEPKSATYMFRGQPYFPHLTFELDFLSDNRRVMENLEFEGKEKLSSSNMNPFICPVPLAVAEEETVKWADEEAFHFCKTRILGEDTDILHVKELSMFLKSEVYDFVEDKFSAIWAEQAAAPVDPFDTRPDSSQNSPDSTKTSPKKLPFFTTAEFKYATYLPRRNVMGDLEGLTEVELAQSLERVGAGKRFDAKSQQWIEDKKIDMASTRRGTFFGTMSRERADKPENKLRRITETVAMLAAREKLTKVKLELEQCISGGKKEDEDVNMLKEELEKLREKADKARDYHDKVLAQGKVEKARKLKVKWSYWYEEQDELAREIKKRLATQFHRKEVLSRCVRNIDRLNDEYLTERNKAIAELKRKAAALERKKAKVIVVIQRWARGMIYRARIYPIIMMKIEAATKMANAQRRKKARLEVERRRKEHYEKTLAATKLQCKVRKKAAGKKVEAIKVEKKEQGNAALILQQKARSRMAVKKVEQKKQQKQENEASVMMQKQFRSSLAIKEAERRRRRKVENASVTVIQCAIRIFLAFKKVARKRAEIKEAKRLAELKRVEEERLRLERLEAERLNKLRIEAERREAERKEKERVEKERLKEEKRLAEVEAEKQKILEAERLAKEKAEKEHEEAKARQKAREEERQRKLQEMNSSKGSMRFASKSLDLSHQDIEIEEGNAELDELSLASKILPGSIDSLSLMSEEESIHLLNEWADQEVGEEKKDADGNVLLPSSFFSPMNDSEENEKDEQWEKRPMTAGKAHYDGLRGTIHAVINEISVVKAMHLAPATPSNVSEVISSFNKDLGSKKAEAYKWLAHHGYQAKLHQSLVTEAREYVLRQQREKFRDLRLRQVEEVAWLTHQAKRYQAHEWLMQKVEENDKVMEEDYKLKRDAVQKELVMLAHRWMY
ncbi:hypothetical protein TrST_g1197 [Triparma strigata]|uniref:Uncharacterized protein n=1 Tax=Triparma strigata TaxID=1606541 RepID=A0A9W7EJE3_9STRA|nr:hypothetical protein TrST_g1197 [Triparma strigata]